MITEASVGAAAADWLRGEGWSVYEEVSLEYQLRGKYDVGDARADLVGTRGELLSVIECKIAISFELFAQAKKWLPFADVVWVAVPCGKRTDGRVEAFRVAREYYGIGVLELRDDGSGIAIRVGPRTHRRDHDALLVSLDPEHQKHASAGSPGGGQWTSFKRTASAVAAYVAKHNGCTLAEALESTEHHYRNKKSAIAALSKAVKKGLIPGVVSGWRQRLYIVGSQIGNQSIFPPSRSW